jgi:acyl carrier protein
MRIALTGATGFVGKAVVDELLRGGSEVRLLVRNPNKVDRAWANLERVDGDLSNVRSLGALVKGADVLVHLAGAINAISREHYFAINRDGTRNLMAAVAQSPIKRVVHVSSMAAREPELSSYAASKAAGELEALALAKSKQVLVLRPSAIYGPGDQATLPLLQQLSRRTAVLPGSPNAKFGLIHVNDFAGIIAEAVNSKRGGVIEVDDVDGPHDWPQLSRIMSETFGTARNVIYLPRSLAIGVAAVSESIGKLNGRPSMITREKLRELYHADWTQRGPNWRQKPAIPLAAERPIIGQVEGKSMTGMDDIITQICKLLGPYNTQNVELKAATDIPAELNIDSVGVMDFIMEVEDHYDIEIPLNVVSETRTVDDLAKVVASRIKGKS